MTYARKSWMFVLALFIITTAVAWYCDETYLGSRLVFNQILAISYAMRLLMIVYLFTQFRYAFSK